MPTQNQELCYTPGVEHWVLEASSLGHPDHTTTKTVHPIASPLLTTALQQWFWRRPSDLGCVDEWEKNGCLIYTSHMEAGQPAFLFSTHRQSKIIWWCYKVMRWLVAGVLHFVNRKFKLTIRVIDLTLTMSRWNLFKLISRSLVWVIAFFSLGRPGL